MRGDGLSELDGVEVADELGETGLVVYDEDGSVLLVETDELESCGWRWKSVYVRNCFRVIEVGLGEGGVIMREWVVKR